MKLSDLVNIGLILGIVSQFYFTIAAERAGDMDQAIYELIWLFVFAYLFNNNRKEA